MELYFNFFEKFYDTGKCEELGMDTDSPYLDLSEENLEVIFVVEKGECWTAVRLRDCGDTFTSKATYNFFADCAAAHTRHDGREPGLLWKNLAVQKCCVIAVERTVAVIQRAISVG